MTCLVMTTGQALFSETLPAGIILYIRDLECQILSASSRFVEGERFFYETD